MKTNDLQAALDRIDELEEALDVAACLIEDYLGSDADDCEDLQYIRDVLEGQYMDEDRGDLH